MNKIDEPFSAVVTNEAINIDAIEIRIRHHSGRAWWDLTYHGTVQANGFAASEEYALRIAQVTRDEWVKCELTNLPETDAEPDL